MKYINLFLAILLTMFTAIDIIRKDYNSAYVSGFFAAGNIFLVVLALRKK